MPLGALLRLAWHAARRHMLAELRASEFAELDDAHLLVFQYPGPQGLRPSDVARRLRTSRQAANYLIAQLEASGYLQRRLAAGHTRRRITLTARGERLRAAMRMSMRRFEQQCRRRAGAARYRTFVAVLRGIASHSAAAPSWRSGS
jgi:DNA-binding MarR family transcriptional regulator